MFFSQFSNDGKFTFPVLLHPIVLKEYRDESVLATPVPFNSKLTEMNKKKTNLKVYCVI